MTLFVPGGVPARLDPRTSDPWRRSDEWDERVWYAMPGMVWSVTSDTCCTGREHAPDNIAYDEVGMEFVFRQPRDRHELLAVQAAAENEVTGCYRFDGLERWTSSSLW